MKSRWLVLFIALCAGFSISPAMGEDTSTIPSAWGKVKFTTPSGNLPFGMAPNLNLSLVAKDGSYRRAYGSGDNPVADALKTGEFHFPDVPADTILYFTLSYTSATGQSNTYRSTLKFHYPELNPVQKLRKKKALKIAGYIGDFAIDVTSAAMSIRSRH